MVGKNFNALLFKISHGGIGGQILNDTGVSDISGTSRGTSLAFKYM